ncbi:DNA helicase [Ranunculus cassubicifolius]
MTHQHISEALDRSLQDITGMNEIFGGKVFIMGGDFRQVLPVIPQGSRTEIINSCIRNSYLWEHIQIIRLQQNMRAVNDPDFSQFLLRVGNYDEYHTADDMISLPQDIVLPWKNKNPLQDLISEVFPNLSRNANNTNYMINRAIITSTNDHVDEINNKIITSFPGEEISYYSFDSVESDHRSLYQPEFLNSINQGNLPPHRLILKVGCPIMLIRNIEPRSGLCNGTRLVCRSFYKKFIDAEIVTGTFKGQTTFLPRIPLKSTTNMKIPFSLTRKQFPIRLSFALTIHKSQGQTIPHVGIYLPHNVFTHGQLYVALSRGTSRKNTKILVQDGTINDCPSIFTRNVVYREVLL